MPACEFGRPGWGGGEMNRASGQEKSREDATLFLLANQHKAMIFNSSLEGG